MPCYTVRYTTVELANANKDLLATALIPLLLKQYGRLDQTEARRLVDAWYDGTRLSVPGNIVGIDTIKQAYSEEVIKSSAQRFGWNMQGSNHEFTLQRRS